MANLNINKKYLLGESPNSFSVKVLDILSDGVSSHKMQYLDDTETKPVTYQQNKDYFCFPGIYLENFAITEL